MYRKSFSGLVAAAGLLTAGTWAVVNAQDPAQDPHDHSPTAIHNEDGSHYEIDDENAYPDADGFASMDERVSYTIGRLDGKQLPSNVEELDFEAYMEGVHAGSNETSEDRAAGYELGRNILRTQPETDVDALIEGIRAGMEETNESRVLGYLISNRYRVQEIEILPDTYKQGVQEALAILDAAEAAGGGEGGEGGEGAEPVETVLTEEQVRETAQAYNVLMQERQLQKLLEEGEAYVQEVVAEEEGWTSTESGLYYRVLEEGEGERPDANDLVTCHYEGKLIDGSVFDSSYQRGEPIDFPLDGVIPGWTEGVQLMNVGSKYEFLIPPKMAYGERGYPAPGGGGIPQNATLRFTVELLGFVARPNDDREPLGD